MTAWTLLRRAAALPPRRLAGIAATMALAGAVEVGLRLAPLPQVARAMGVRAEPPSAGAGARRADEIRFDDRELERIDDVRKVLSRRPFNGTCLRQSLLVGRALRRRDPALCVGVKKSAGQVRAHAWIVVDGWIVDDYTVQASGDADFVRLDLERV